MNKFFISLGMCLILGFGIMKTSSLIVSADTTEIEAELGGYDDIFKLSEVHIENELINIYELEKLDKDGISEKLSEVGIELKSGAYNNGYDLVYNNEVIGDILINDYVTSLNLKSDKVKMLGGISINDKKLREELEYILKYNSEDKETWYGALNKGKTYYDWCVEIGDETEDNALGFIYNENELQIDEYRIRFGFDSEGNVVALQFNLFHGAEGISTV